MKILNKLDKTELNAYLKIDDGDTVGVGLPDSSGARRTSILAGDELEIDLPQIPTNELKLFFIFEEMPVKGNLEGAKIAPGTRFGFPHHFEFYKQEFRGEKKFVALLHYDFRDHNHKEIEEMFTHIDPQVHHPENGGNFVG